MEALQDKVIVVIGGTTGLGLSAARACIEEGARVVAVGRSSESVQQAQDLLGPMAHVFSGDARDEITAVRAIAAARGIFGGFHGLYHVAGGSGRRHGDGPLHEITTQGWTFTLQENLETLFYSNRAAAQAFLEIGQGGSIVNMGSVLGISPSRVYFASHAYAAAKAAIIGMSRAAASYYAPHNIRVNVVAPGLVETPMAGRARSQPEIMEFVATKQPLDGGRIGAPQDLDGAVVLLLSDASRFITGQVLAIDGGWSVTEGQYPRGGSNEPG